MTRWGQLPAVHMQMIIAQCTARCSLLCCAVVMWGMCYHVCCGRQVSPHARAKDLASSRYISILNIIQGEVDPSQV